MSLLVYNFLSDCFHITDNVDIDSSNSVSIPIPMNPLEFYVTIVMSDTTNTPHIQLDNTDNYHTVLDAYIHFRHFQDSFIVSKTRKFHIKPFDVIQQYTTLPCGTTFSIYHFLHL